MELPECYIDLLEEEKQPDLLLEELRLMNEQLQHIYKLLEKGKKDERLVSDVKGSSIKRRRGSRRKI